LPDEQVRERIDLLFVLDWRENAQIAQAVGVAQEAEESHLLDLWSDRDLQRAKLYAPNK